MFDRQAFRTWPLVIAGALIFASLFMIVMLMAEVVVGGRALLSRRVLAIGGAAFTGYVAVAYLLRREEPPLSP